MVQAGFVSSENGSVLQGRPEVQGFALETASSTLTSFSRCLRRQVASGYLILG